MPYYCKLCKDNRSYGHRETIRKHIREFHKITGPNWTQTHDRMPSSITEAHVHRD